LDKSPLFAKWYMRMYEAIGEEEMTWKKSKLKIQT
jgi:hypothetical protein